MASMCYCSVALSDSNKEFYGLYLLNLFFNKSEFNSQPLTIVPTKFLHVHGLFLAEFWIDMMAKESHLRMHNLSKQQNDDKTSITFVLQDGFSVSSISYLYDNLKGALLALPIGKTQLTLTVSPRYNLNYVHLLRAAQCWRKTTNVLDDKKTFVVLIDSECSVSCSGFSLDFHGKLAYGNFGHKNTANSQAKIQGFGILPWDVISKKGYCITIMVPRYYSPSVQMHLLLP